MRLSLALTRRRGNQKRREPRRASRVGVKRLAIVCFKTGKSDLVQHTCCTILIRFDTGGRDVPFDLNTDRYVDYDRENPAASIGLLAKSIKDTINAIANADWRPDSPVFLLLPALAPTDLAKLIVVPREFQEAVERAENDGSNGRTTLALLAEEAKLNVWAREDVWLVGRAQRWPAAGCSRSTSWRALMCLCCLVISSVP
jgi:hypothetical protein